MRHHDYRWKFAFNLRIRNVVVGLFTFVMNLLSSSVKLLTAPIRVPFEFLPNLPVTVISGRDMKLIIEDSLPGEVKDIIVSPADCRTKAIFLGPGGKLLCKNEVIGPTERLPGHLYQPVCKGEVTASLATIRYPPVIFESIEKPNSIESVAGPQGVGI